MDIRLPYLTPTSLSKALEAASRARQSTHHQEMMQHLLELAQSGV
ncbi:hypothetical protein [Porphyromonas uenonis]|uniref:Uncharacterized protein n=2 Tax=Porphyromonas uenonis 60-3 TaxID=596327 RepID=C2M963_9PORP|nr:hypothetical protein [Porphyromonas uenonis]EEK16247.1 hypothetical protein PORUE0001_2030 [Porphyromonas uenonis 60-3]EEK17351.1 hypothetical protein PORUE0001_2029 [Porphyromonas uenonis 60-3]EEK17734.1 hypothetical protein PORUE0001_1450 [Porphyromonas uenonis 60-3]